LVNKYYLDDFYQSVIDHVVLAGSRVLAWFDRSVVNDTGVDGSAYTTSFMGYLLKFQQTGKLPNYALAMVIGVVALAPLGHRQRQRSAQIRERVARPPAPLDPIEAVAGAAPRQVMPHHPEREVVRQDVRARNDDAR
jgi:hypothetical protein